MSNKEIIIKASPWSEHEREIRLVRYSVFVVEQSVPEELDFDGLDAVCCHALAFSRDEAVATGRMQSDGHIGRIAVLKTHRGQGIGTSLVRFFLNMAKQKNMELVYLNAQVTAIGFYETLGFHRTGDVFMDAGIEHVRMERESG